MTRIFPTTPSPVPAPGRSASSASPQGEGSLSSGEADHNAIAGLLSVAGCVVWGLILVAALRHPAAAVFAVGLVVANIALCGGALFAAHRGDASTGIADTQGRDADL